MNTLKQATEAFLSKVDWVDLPELEVVGTSLLMLAEDYDADRKPSIYAQYGLMYRYLISLKPVEEDAEFDPLEAILVR